MSDRICSVPDCGRRHHSRGYCRLHVERVRRNGTSELRPKPTLAERFAAKVVMPELPSGCWLWSGAKNQLGYGQIWVGDEKRVVMAHRVSVILSGRVIPAGYDVDHLCRRPSCVNPDHLEPVSHQENMARAPWSAPEAARSASVCRNNHPYTDENTEQTTRMGRPTRRCLTCHEAARQREYAAKRAARRASIPVR